ncbi:glycosyltransferase family 9 protein [Flagellimonas meridianipacifica]|uniref:ADP-heptose:LPS heptosyltransferase n=1 Tax=Flagellimonas meridianipacifica TaxID=1080225 RepID=A0A2T0MEX4_9FLAO|nr:glycosyltransferase family 9 protein [Allomuricauda pacifica]PRX56114.1 ADP-heptose:LPS heptosyltransferase [Allomuricauda pacifica]
MSIKKLNPLKNKIFKVLTGSFRNSKRINLLESLPRDSEIKVLITRPNHRLGNQLLITPLIQEINKQFPNCKIHLIVNGNLSYILLSNYHCVETIFNLPKKPFNNIIDYLIKSISLISNQYNIAIVGCEDSNSSKIFVKLSRAKFKIYNSGTTKLNRPEHIAKIPIYNLRKFLDPSDYLTDRYPKLSIKLSRQEIEKGNQRIKALFNSNKKTICIFTFATGNKCLSKKWWLKFYKELKTEFTNFNVLEILPNENVSQINYESVHFYSNNLREIASVIENSVVFIGADSGIMHLSSSTNTTTFGLFNVTDPKTYGPYGGNNIPLDTNSVKINEILERIKEAIF